MKKFILLLCLFSIGLSFAQTPTVTKPDYAEIKMAIEDRTSELFYPTLMDRLAKRDTTLNAVNLHHLYYGYALQNQYDPYRIISDKKLQKLLMQNSLSAAEQSRFILLANKELETDPFDLRLMKTLAYVYHLAGDENNAYKISTLYNKIVATILSSGDGRTCATAFHVTAIAHEYEVLFSLNLQSEGQALIERCDYLRFEKGKYPIDGLYFDVSKLLDSE